MQWKWYVKVLFLGEYERLVAVSHDYFKNGTFFCNWANLLRIIQQAQAIFNY